MTSTAIMLQAAAQGSGWSSILMIVALFAILYFMMIRPQQKKQKEIQKYREQLAKDDRVVTAGGIYGTIREVRATTFLIDIDKTTCVEVDKNSVYPRPDQPAQK